MQSGLHACTVTLQIAHDTLKVLVRDPDEEDVLRAEFSDHPHHPNALLRLLEADHYPYPPVLETGRFRAVRTRRFSVRCNWVKITQLLAIT